MATHPVRRGHMMRILSATGNMLGKQESIAMTLRYNFSAGPSPLPPSVIEQVRADIPEWNGQGTSIMEISHRSPAFTEVVERSEQDLRELLALSDDYEILWLQGGASSQFSLVPMNLGGPSHTGCLLYTSPSPRDLKLSRMPSSA